MYGSYPYPTPTDFAQQQQQQQIQLQKSLQTAGDNNTTGSSPKLSKENSGKSPHYNYSPAILDFLEDDTIFMQANEESKRGKSKTEFVKTRERQESEDSCHEETCTPPGNNSNNQGGSEDVQAYINSIVPNNSIKFAKPTQSVSDPP